VDSFLFISQLVRTKFKVSEDSSINEACEKEDLEAMIGTLNWMKQDTDLLYSDVAMAA